MAQEWTMNGGYNKMTYKDAIQHLKNIQQIKKYNDVIVDGIPLNNFINDIIALLNTQKFMNTEPVKYGRWKEFRTKVRGYGKVWYQHCTPMLFESPYFYCPTCGMRMEEKNRK